MPRFVIRASFVIGCFVIGYFRDSVQSLTCWLKLRVDPQRRLKGFPRPTEIAALLVDDTKIKPSVDLFGI